MDENVKILGKDETIFLHIGTSHKNDKISFQYACIKCKKKFEIDEIDNLEACPSCKRPIMKYELN